MMHAALGIWLFSAVACVGRAHHHHTSVDINSLSLVSSGNKEFAFHLYRKLAALPQSQGKNVFFSPRSVSVALAALSTGTRGETHQQLFNGLGFNNSLLTQAQVDQAFYSLLNTSNTMTGEHTSEGTAVFVANSFKPQPEFLEVLKHSYLADGFNVDFSHNQEAIDTINEYVKEKTNGKIDAMVESLEPDTIMFLISYIYFKGKWANQFDPKLTKEEDFTVDENTKVRAQMMNMVDFFYTNHDQDLDTTVLSLPFNSSYSMILLLPGDMAKLETEISPGLVKKWLKWMTNRNMDISVPKFSIKSSFSLNNLLMEMGMTHMFGADADFSGISDVQGLFVSQVTHKATLDVDEGGATASGATGIEIMPLSAHYVPVLKFDRPFMVLITEKTTGNILFMGKIVNPTI